MATVKGKTEGKSMFLKEYLVDHPGAGKEAIDAAWREAGNEGTISTSLIGKVRKDLGLTGKGTAQAKSRARVGTGQRLSTDAKSDVRGAGPAGGDRARVLIRLEGAIDDLLHEIKMAGGLPEFEETPRRARRLLVPRHRA